MTKAEIAETLRKIRAAVETDEDQFDDDFAENFIEKIDSVIHFIER